MARTSTFAPARTPWGWAFFGAVLGLLLATVLFAPAVWLAGRVQAASGGQVLLQDARGTVWNGSTQLTLTGGPGSSDSSTLPGRLAWRVQPGWGQLQVSVFADCCMQTPLALDLLPRWGGVHLRMQDQRSQWPALLLTGLGTPWNTLQLGGQLQLSSTGLRLQTVAGQLRLAGDLQLQLRGASSRLSALPVLGSYQLLLQGSGQGDAPTTLRLSSQEGPLRLNGEGQWTGARLRFRGTAQATDGQDDALANLLNIIGRRQGALSVISIG